MWAVDSSYLQLPHMPSSRTLKTRLLGKYTETIACTFLQQQSLVLLARNVQSRFGEIDLVMRDHDCIVFVEVRYRKHARFGGALASVTYHKQQRLLKTAMIYLQRQPQLQDLPLRFDVVTLEGNNTVVSHWVKHAFMLNDEW